MCLGYKQCEADSILLGLLSNESVFLIFVVVLLFFFVCVCVSRSASVVDVYWIFSHDTLS